MKVKNVMLMIGVSTLLLLTGCGGETSTSKKDDVVQDVVQAIDTDSLLTTDNYLDLAKYYYLQESRDRNTMQSRSMTHLNDVNDKSDKNTIYVKSNRDISNIVKSMIIKNRNALVSVSIEDANVKVTLHGTNSEVTQTLTLAEFKSFDIDETMINEGEE